jgi:hypothetical protein
LTLEKKEGSYTSKFNKVKVVMHGFEKTGGELYDLTNDVITISLK